MSRLRSRAQAFARAAVLGSLASCTPVVRYTDELVDSRFGRSLFTRLPATIGATAGFAIGLPFDVLALPVSVPVYATQPSETRDPLSVFLFPSFVLWKAGALLGTPFDLVELALWRSWHAPAPRTQEEWEAIEREWDAKEYTEYPVTPIWPAPIAPTTTDSPGSAPR